LNLVLGYLPVLVIGMESDYWKTAGDARFSNKFW
jgi:hypothetical protein